LPSPLPPRYLGAVTDAVALAGWELTPGDRNDPVTLFIQTNATGPNGEVVPAEEAAKAIVEKFDVTRSESDANGHQVPVGVVVTARIRIQNAIGKPVRIFWKLEDAGGRTERLSREWMAGAPALLLRAQSTDDRGVFSLWVPVPRKRGTYILDVTASHPGAGSPDDFFTTRPFH
jgi:hypothetical protein